MKLINILIFITLFSAACSEGANQSVQSNHAAKSSNKNIVKIDSFTLTIFKALKNNDFESYQQYFINSADLDYFFLRKLSHLMAKKSTTPQTIEQLKKGIKQARAGFAAKRKHKLISLKRSFERLRSTAAKSGVNWNTAKFKGRQLENARHIYKIATADIIITFIDKNIHYQIKIPRCQFVRRGWIYSENIRWEGTYK